MCTCNKWAKSSTAAMALSSDCCFWVSDMQTLQLISGVKVGMDAFPQKMLLLSESITAWYWLVSKQRKFSTNALSFCQHSVSFRSCQFATSHIRSSHPSCHFHLYLIAGAAAQTAHGYYIAYGNNLIYIAEMLDSWNMENLLFSPLVHGSVVFLYTNTGKV